MMILIVAISYFILSLYLVVIVGGNTGMSFEEALGWAVFWPVLIVVKAIKGFIKLIKQ